MKCEKGNIMRKSFLKKTGAKVKSTCIKDLGLTGKGPIILPKLQQGSLTQFGYSSKNSGVKRHNSLKKAIKKYTKSAVIHKLNAISTLTKNTNPVLSGIYKEDLVWVQNFS
jgi:hypothetical protein